ncbi:hypothetical protein ACIHEI_34765 [Kitasatospora sp. NPDC051984]|uniref:hypothetical protein n=1 Tax=Kitasatospora sp. NPDC051984 TaxID=3364059 RepID=UPI0037C674E2
MSQRQLSDLAGGLRSDHLRFLRSADSRMLYSHFESEGHPLLCPARWADLPRRERIDRVLAAEDRRVTGGATFVLDTPVVDAVRALASDRSLPLIFTEDVLPASSGLLVTAAPLYDAGTYSIVAASWGPAMEGFGPGVHLTWWSDGRSVNNGVIPLMRDFELHLPYAPLLDTRLTEATLPDDLTYSAEPLRAVVAAWYALTDPTTELSDQRPSPVIGRALAAQKAKQRTVRVATTVSADTTRQAILTRATTKHSWLFDTYGPQIGGIDPETTPPPARLSHGPFPEDLDHQLPPDLHHAAQLYREVADRCHRRETEIFQQYPGILEQLEELRVRDHGTWEPWCWMPVGEIAHWLIQQWHTPRHQAFRDAERIAAIGAWRSGGRHVLLHGGPRYALPPSAQVPVRELFNLPVRGIGIVTEDGTQTRVSLAYLNQRAGRDDAELVLISDEWERGRSFRDLIKTTLFLTDGQNLTEAVKATGQHYDEVDRAAGRAVPPLPGEDTFLQMSRYMGWYTGALAAASAPGAAVYDVGAAAGRKPAAPWPPTAGMLPELVLWRMQSNEES